VFWYLKIGLHDKSAEEADESDFESPVSPRTILLGESSSSRFPPGVGMKGKKVVVFNPLIQEDTCCLASFTHFSSPLRTQITDCLQRLSGLILPFILIV